MDLRSLRYNDACAVMGWVTSSVNNIGTLKETFKKEIYTFVCERVKYTKMRAVKLSGTIGHELSSS